LGFRQAKENLGGKRVKGMVYGQSVVGQAGLGGEKGESANFALSRSAKKKGENRFAKLPGTPDRLKKQGRLQMSPC